MFNLNLAEEKVVTVLNVLTNWSKLTAALFEKVNTQATAQKQAMTAPVEALKTEA
jgi:hypothetical protein